MWLSNQPNKAELCKKNDIAKEVCPDTCNNKCSVQDLRFRNTRTTILD